VSTAIAHNSHTVSETVWQPFVKLFAIHYGLTFCLLMRTLYDTSLGPTLSFQTYTIRQLDLMPKILRSGSVFAIPTSVLVSVLENIAILVRWRY